MSLQFNYPTFHFHTDDIRLSVLRSIRDPFFRFHRRYSSQRVRTFSQVCAELWSRFWVRFPAHWNTRPVVLVPRVVVMEMSVPPPRVSHHLPNVRQPSVAYCNFLVRGLLQVTPA